MKLLNVSVLLVTVGCATSVQAHSFPGGKCHRIMGKMVCEQVHHGRRQPPPPLHHASRHHGERLVIIRPPHVPRNAPPVAVIESPGVHGHR